VNEVVSKRFCKKQQMQWSKEVAHLLWQTRVRTLNGELSAIFKHWYPGMDLEVEEMLVAGRHSPQHLHALLDMLGRWGRADTFGRECIPLRRRPRSMASEAFSALGSVWRRRQPLGSEGATWQATRIRPQLPRLCVARRLLDGRILRRHPGWN
jgi:hypothetical protein